MEKDPVCGMEVEPSTAPFKEEYEGKVYYLCSRECLETFQKSPEKFTDKEK